MVRTLSLVLTILLVLPRIAAAHGGVVLEADQCVIKIAYMKARFKIYQPRVDGQKQYCEDLPNATESLFVMEYLHDGLTTTPIDFRIIRNVTGKGRYARWGDVEKIPDLAEVTVFHRPPAVDPDVFTTLYDFDTEGEYVGIVTASVGDAGRTYRAVFPFRVGFVGFGYWPGILAILVALQLQYVLTSERFKRWRAARWPRLRLVPGGGGRA
jgi:hypothetical protein